MEVTSLQEILEIAEEVCMNKEEKMLREYIRKKLFKKLFEQERQEFQLRKVIRKLLREGDISDVHPHRSTAINTLEDVLKKAIPTLRTDYKRLTTDKAQRESFRAHILKAMEDSVKPSMNNAKYGEGGTLLSEPSNLEDKEEETKEPEEPKEPEEDTGEETEEDAGEETEDAVDDLAGELKALEEAEIDIVDKSDDEKKLNVEPDEEPDEKSEFGSGLEGMDETGRNMAYTTFRKISQYILDAFDMLANLKDKEVFIDYLLTNTKLYFDKFESELQKTVDEPDSPEA